MSDLKELAPRFHALLLGLERGHGSYQDIDWDNARADGKFEGRAVTLHEPVTHVLWERHLAGRDGIGIIPTMENSACVFGAIDIDVYADLDHGRIAAAVEKLGFPLITCRSKSGGCHLFLFTALPVPAGDMQDRLRDIAARLGYGGAEIFPKQRKIGNNKSDLGSWINCPYQNAAETLRYAVDVAGNALSPEEFLAAAAAAKVGPDFFRVERGVGKKEKTKGELLLPGGPPCLQILMDQGFPEGTWNTGTHNLGIFCKKASPGNWKEKLTQLNAENFAPDKWSMDDLNIITKSLAKKEYYYDCSRQPLVSRCNSALCRTREHGVGHGTAKSLPVLGGLIKYDSNPPLYRLECDEGSIDLEFEELKDYRKFKDACLRRLNTVLPLLKAKDWDDILRDLFKTLTTVPVPEDASPDGRFWEQVKQFCTGRMAYSKQEVSTGKPFIEKGRVFFAMSGLMLYLDRKKFRYQKLHEVAAILRNRGGKPAIVCGSRAWSVPEFLPRSEEQWEVPDDISAPVKQF